MSDLAKLTDLASMISRDIPECGPGLILIALKEVAREFCIKTEAWRSELDPIDIVAEETAYDLRVKAEAAVHRLFLVEIDGVEIDPSLFALSDNGWQIVLDDSIEPASAITDGLVVTIVLRPFADCTEYDEWFLDRYAETIVAGTKSRLFFQRKTPWYDPDSAKRFDREYVTGRSLARRETYTKHTMAPLQMRIRNWI